MRYFTIKELTHSDTAKARGIDNTPPAEAVRRLETLVEHCLDPLRQAWGAPIRVNSGYRCPALNKAVGGTATSQHLKGEAADITAGSKAANKKLFELAKTMDFDQLIDEKNYSWVHISYRGDGKNRRQILRL